MRITILVLSLDRLNKRQRLRVHQSISHLKSLLQETLTRCASSMLSPSYSKSASNSTSIKTHKLRREPPPRLLQPPSHLLLSLNKLDLSPLHNPSLLPPLSHLLPNNLVLSPLPRPSLQQEASHQAREHLLSLRLPQHPNRPAHLNLSLPLSSSRLQSLRPPLNSKDQSLRVPLSNRPPNLHSSHPSSSPRSHLNNSLHRSPLHLSPQDRNHLNSSQLSLRSRNQRCVIPTSCASLTLATRRYS